MNAVGAVFAAAALAVGLAFRFAPAVPTAVVVLGACYAAVLGRDVERIDTRAPVVAAALFALAELAYWSTELRAAVADEPGTYLRRVALLAGWLLAVIAAGTIVLALVEAIEVGGIAVELVGAAAAVAALALVARAASRAP